jgi:hypothetical protein
MSDFGKVKQGFAAALAAFVLTSTAVGAAVGPARALETSPLYAQAQVAGSHV